MKKILFIHHFYSRIRISAMITFLVMTISIFAVCIVSGVLQYQTYSYDMLKNKSLKNSLYIMVENNFTTSAGENQVENVIEKMEEYGCVDAVLNVKGVNSFIYNQSCVTIFLYSEEMLQIFPMRTSGKYRIDDLKADITDGIPVIVGSNIFGDAANAETVSLKMKSAKGFSTDIIIKPITKLKEPYLPVTFSGGGSRVTAEQLFSSSQCLIAYESPELLAYFEEYADTLVQPNFFVKLKPEYDQQEYEEMISYISTIGSYASYEEILENTKEDAMENLKLYMPMPLYLMLSSFICVLSVTIMTVYKKQKDVAVFHLCGMSRGKIWIHFIISLSVIYWMAAFINMYIVSLIKKVDTSYPIGIRIMLQSMLIDDGTIGHILLYMLLVLLIVSVVPLVMLRKEAPMNILRRVE